MNILLSAYACEPGRGSEPGVGWRWAIELARLGHRVRVITRTNNREPIEAALTGCASGDLQFIYYDLPAWARCWKRGARGVHLYYLLWQFGAFRVAKRLTRQTRFDRVHHITFGVFRHPSFMAFLGVPFVFGPVGGGESAPRALRQSFPLRGRVADFLRDLSNRLALFDPLLRATFRRAELILCKTRETRDLIPASCRRKCRVELEIGIDLPETAPLRLPAGAGEGGAAGCRLLYAGRLIYWKGLHLGLAALARLRARHPEVRLTVVGAGPDEQWLRDTACRLGLADAVDWHGWLPRDELLALYGRHDAFVFPSLHDSSGNVVLEALGNGLPVVCLDLGGPAAIVDETCALVVATGRHTEEAVVAELAIRLESLVLDSQLRQRLADGALARARQFEWREVVARVYPPAVPAWRAEVRHV